jgi:lysophospholipase L1-like esterase
MDLVVHEAEKEHLGLIPSLFWLRTAVSDFCDEPIGETGNPDSKTRAFYRKYASDMAERYKNSPAVWGWEIGNEYMLGADLPKLNHLPAPKAGSNEPRTAADKIFRPMILDLYEEVYRAIRAIDPDRIIVTGDSLTREAAWYNHYKDDWGLDTRKQWLEMFAADTPDCFNAVSIHLYPEHDKRYFQGEKVSIEEVVSAAVRNARKRNKPVWCGEFGAAACGDGERQMALRMFRIIRENQIELSALWNFVPNGEFQRDADVSPSNDRAWMLSEIKEFNQCMEETAACSAEQEQTVPDICGLPSWTTQTVRPFEDGDRVVFIGDSITHWGPYAYTVAAFYQTRFPGKDIRFFYKGMGGYTAGQWLQHVDELTVNHPTVATVMLGMNDSGYDDPWKLPEEKRNEALGKLAGQYRANMDELISRLRSSGVRRIILILSSPYDETRIIPDNPPLAGKNQFMRDVLGKYLLEKSRELGEPLMDFNTPLLQINQTAQAGNPAFSIADKGDRIHPVKAGQAVMAWLFLAYQGLNAPVSETVIHAQRPPVVQTENCTVSGLQSTDATLSWTSLENALPFPGGVCANPGILKRDDWAMPFYRQFEEKLNTELLQVTGLPAGVYELRIDDLSVGKYSCEELQSGVNLAENVNTPQYRQAASVNQWHAEEKEYPPDSAYGYWMFKWNSDKTLDLIRKELQPVPHCYRLVRVP